MKQPIELLKRALWVALAMAAAPLNTMAATVNLPASAALPPGSASARGFVVRTVQAPQEATVGNNAQRAVKQINGTLTDAAGAPIANEAAGGTNPDGSFDVTTVNFERDGAEILLKDLEGNELIAFGSQLFPGIPGLGGHADKFATEVVAFLELPAGSTTFGVSTTAERTDINDDDGYQLYVAQNPRDYFGLKVAEYERIAPGFQNNWRNENQVTVVAPQAGVYPFRILYWQTGAGASLAFYTLIADTGERILVNDDADPRAIKAYKNTSVAAAKGPYIAEASPAGGSDGNSPSAPIEALIIDGATTVAVADVKLTLNGAAVTPQTRVKSDNRITVAYNPNASRQDANNAVRLEFKDSAGATYAGEWSFKIRVAGGSATTLAGQWDFNSGDLRGTVGKALSYLDGANGLTAQGTRFGTTTELGVPDIAGQPARVMEVPGDVRREIGYVMEHGIASNGGGTRVNQYTLILDVYVDVTGPGAASLWQTSSAGNTDDGDLFWQGNNFGQGGGGYNGRGTFTAGAWHRVVAAYDMAATPPVVTKYVDGIKQDDWTANQGLDNTRRSLAPTAILFADGDQDERRKMWVNSVQIRAGKISDAEAAALGGPTAAGIPANPPASNVTGQWEFDFADLGANIGKPLAYLDPTFDGPEGSSEDKTGFGTTTELGIADINGVAAKVLRVPGTLSRQIGYVMQHGIAPNGGGTRVNQYTLIMDVFVQSTGAGAASLWQTSSAGNTDDGDLFWQGNNFGQGGGGYNGRGTFTAGAWHRVVAAYDMAATPPLVAKFVDGIKQDDWTANQGLDNVRRSLAATAILFGDGDQDERREMFVNSVQIRSGRITDAQAAWLGGPSANGIPISLPDIAVTGHWDFEFGDLGASVGSNLAYLDPAYDGPAGSAEDKTQFGTTTEFGIADIGTGPVKVMRVPGTLTRQLGYVMTHRIPPNGGGTRVNQYTLILDVYVQSTGAGAASLWQTSSAGNTDDGDLFWQGNNFGQGGGGYNGTGAFTAGAWHRVVAAYDMAANPPVVTKYVDGIFQDNWTANQGLDNVRRSLAPTAILFADGDQDERREMFVSSVQIRSGKLSDAEMVALGAPTPGGIPLVIEGVAPAPEPPTLTIVRNANGSITIAWQSESAFTLESKTDVAGATWTPVSGVQNNSITFTPSAAASYFRLRL